MSRQQDIEKILSKVYGKNYLTEPLARELDENVLNEPDLTFRRLYVRIWDYYPGGDTAAYVANKIVEALDLPVIRQESDY